MCGICGEQNLQDVIYDFNAASRNFQMKREDEVLCVACDHPFPVGLLELVRWSGPLWCQKCIAHADQELVEAAGRARKADEIVG